MKRPLRARGFTMVELIVVMVLVGVIAAVAIPKLMDNGAMAAASYGDRIVSGLRHAQHVATSHRRVVCVTVGTRDLTLRIATAPGPSACSTTQPLGGLDPDDYRSADTALAISENLAGDTVFFHPDGTIHANAAGTAPLAPGSRIVVSAAGTAVRTIELHGESGYVE